MADDFDFDFGDIFGEDPIDAVDAVDEDAEPVDIVLEDSHPLDPIEPIGEDLTDEKVDDIFASITAGIENDEAVQKAMALVIEAEAVVAQAEADYEKSQERVKELDAERKELEKRLAEISRERATIQNENWDVRSKVYQAKQNKEAAEREVELARAAATAKAQFERMSATYEARAKGKAWYEGIKMTDRETGEEKILKILEHQWVGAKFLASAERALLGDGMGLGKTLTAIAALDLVESKKALVIAPADVTSNFVNEIRMWAPHRNVITIKGMTKAERNVIMNAIQVLENVIIVVNYEAWRKDFSLLDRFGDMGFDTVIADEAHTVKTTTSDAFKGVERVVLMDNICPQDGTMLMSYPGLKVRKCPKCDWCGQSFDVYDEERKQYLSWEERYWLSKTVKNVWPMTGTPILNNPADIFAPLSLIDPHNFTDKSMFLRMYCEMDPNTGRWDFQYGGLDRLKKRLKGRYLARTMDDAGIVLPEQKPIIHLLEIDPDNYPDQYRTMVQLTKYAQIVLSDGRAMNPMATIALITRQRQAAVWPGGIEVWEPEVKDAWGNVIQEKRLAFKVSEEVNESIKIDKAIEIISEFVPQGKRIALFSQFSTALEEIQNRINGMMLDNGQVVRSVRYDGSTPDSIKEQVKRNFNKSQNEEAKWDVVLTNYKSGGVGLNFTEVEHTIILDEEWNPGKRDQAYGRTRRIGQNKETFVHVLMVKSSIDDWMHGLISQKEDMIEGFKTETLDIQQALLKAITNGEVI